MKNKILTVVCLSIALMSCATTQSVKLANNSVHIKYDRATAFNPEPSLEGMMNEAIMRCGTTSPELIADACAWSNGIFCFSWTYIYDCGTDDGSVQIQAAHESEPEGKPALHTKQEKQSASTQPVVAEPEARPARTSTSNSERDAKYRECIRQYPSDWCSDWHLTDGAGVGHGN